MPYSEVFALPPPKCFWVNAHFLCFCSGRPYLRPSTHYWHYTGTGSLLRPSCPDFIYLEAAHAALPHYWHHPGTGSLLQPSCPVFWAGSLLRPKLSQHCFVGFAPAAQYCFLQLRVRSSGPKILVNCCGYVNSTLFYANIVYL